VQVRQSFIKKSFVVKHVPRLPKKEGQEDNEKEKEKEEVKEESKEELQVAPPVKSEANDMEVDEADAPEDQESPVEEPQEGAGDEEEENVGEEEDMDGEEGVEVELDEEAEAQADEEMVEEEEEEAVAAVVEEEELVQEEGADPAWLVHLPKKTAAEARVRAEVEAEGTGGAKRRRVDVQLPREVAERYEEACIFAQLCALERRVEAAVARKRMELAGAPPAKVKRVLQVLVWNTHHDQQPPGQAPSQPPTPSGPPSGAGGAGWTLHIAGRLKPQEGFVDAAGGRVDLTAFLDRVAVQFPPDVSPPLPTVAPTRVPTVHSLPPFLTGAVPARRVRQRLIRAPVGPARGGATRRAGPGRRAGRAGGHVGGIQRVGRRVRGGRGETPPLVLSGHAASLTPY
jgi:hypothetical protein